MIAKPRQRALRIDVGRPRGWGKELNEHIRAAAELHQPLTLRQLYYRLVSAGTIPKDQQQYHSVAKRVNAMRNAGTIPWAWITEHGHTAWGRGREWRGPSEAVASLADDYKRWWMQAQPVYVEVWTESASAADIVAPAAAGYDVGTVPCGGYVSKTWLHQRANVIAGELRDRPVLCLYVGDLDDHGQAIENDWWQSLRRHVAAIESGSSVDDADLGHPTLDGLTYRRLAVTPEQVVTYDLDRLRMEGKVEVEAFTTSDLRTIVSAALDETLDLDALGRERWAEEMDRGRLRDLVDEWEDDDES